MLSERHAKLLEARGLEPDLLERYGAHSSTPADGDWLVIPYFDGDAVVNRKYRTLPKDRFKQDAGGRKVFWNQVAIIDPGLASQPLIITEGELDAFAAIQAGFLRTVSVPDGAPSEPQGERDGSKYSYVADAQAVLRDVREIILCTDADGPGVALLNDLAIRLGKARCKWVRYPQGCKDLNDALARYGVRGVVETINRAQWMRVDGVYRMSELPPVAESRPHEIGIPGLEPHYRVRFGDVAIVTGIPSHGKTALVNDVCCRLASRYGWTVAFASFEQAPQLDHRRNLRTWFCRKRVIYQTREETAEADRWIDEHFVFIAPNEDDEVTLPWTLERCAAAIVQQGAKVIVIDPWNEMDHTPPPDMTLTQYTGFAIKQFRKLAKKYQVHLIVVAHPAKQQREKGTGKYPIPSLYDISDSAHWYNKADVGIVVHREEAGRTRIRIAKSRYHDQIGKPGDVMARFCIEDGRFSIEDPSDEQVAA